MQRHTFFYALWDEPPVFVITAGLTLEDGLALAVSVAAGRPSYLLVRLSWLMEAQAPQVAAADRWLKANHPNLRLTAIAREASELASWGKLHVSALHAHNLAFVDESIYRPDPAAPKLYHAVHNAQADAFKRHELALGVPNLALITYQARPGGPDLAALTARYRQLAYVNQGPDGLVFLTGEAVRDIVVKAHCGLLLSQAEGATNAVMEYFLCGVPLVTTPSIGGRDVMYEPGHVQIVEPSAAAVEAAVARFVAESPDPLAIRASALAKTRAHRRRMIEWLSAVAERDLFALADDDLWLPQFCDKLRESWVLRLCEGAAADARRISRPARPRSPRQAEGGSD
jgi:hypothetical protein